MKRLLLIVLVLAVSTSVAVAQKTKTSGNASAGNETSVSKQGREVNLASNTALAAQLENSLDAKRTKVGDTVVLKTTQALKQNGEVIVPKGAKLIGHVTEVQQHSKSNGESRIGVAFDRLQKGSLDMPITASIVSITQARSQTRATDSSVESDAMASSSTRTTTRSSGGGGLLGGVGNAVGGTVNTTTSTVGNVAGTTTNAVGSTVGATTSTAGNLTGSLKGLQIKQSTTASAEGGSTLSLNTGNVRLESGATFNLLVSSSTNAGTRQ
ncbi:MAG TPA: hypothetical protein VFX97_09260 [Pyrinomonadaceae bacterium]|nr:hypothetical protein [Pyrinomonadaceae bacterium]